MNFLFLLINACFCRPPPVTQPTDKSTVEIRFDDPDLVSGKIVDGVFQDAIFPFQGAVSDEWEVKFGAKFGMHRLGLYHPVTSTRIEIWRFPYPLIEPAPLDFCDWSFVDLGLYSNSSPADPRMVATCFPEDSARPFVFGMLRHRNQGTWQFEIHTAPKNMLLSKKIGEELLSNFFWTDEQDPVLQQIN